MKRLVIIMPAFLLVVGAYAQTRAESIRARLLNPSEGSVLVASHRGVWDEEPENSVASIEAAIAAGADIVEIDVRKTLGGELVLHHGPLLFRPSDATTLEEALLVAKDRVLVNIDKAFRHFDRIIEIAERTGTLDQIIFKSGVRAHEAYSIMGDYAGRVLFMPIIHFNEGGALAEMEEYLSMLQAPVYEWVFTDDSRPELRIASARLQGISRIWVNTMWARLCGGHDDTLSRTDPDAAYGWLVNELGVSAIQTDRTFFVAEYLKGL